MSEHRLPEQPSQVVDRSSELTFYFDGKATKAYRGDTIASALYAQGTRIFNRSFKYHRPRGLLCVSGRCPNCLMTVDGIPNVRACTEPVRQGMKVSHQNAWPSLNRDLLSFLDNMGFLMPVGFYYKGFVWPKFMWPLAQPVIRRVAGLGRIDASSDYRDHYQHYNHHADVAVVGGGPAGVSAAIEAARAGASVALIDDQPSLGGHLRGQELKYMDVWSREVSALEDATLFEEALATPNLEVMPRATAFGLYEGNLLGVVQEKRLVKLRSKRIVVATGCQEVPLVFQGNDLPGVMLSTGVQRLIHLYGLRPGKRALVVTNNNQGYIAATDLLHVGVHVVAVADARPTFPEDLPEIQELKSRDVPILASYTAKEARGRRRVKEMVLVGLNGGAERRFPCDLVCVAAGFDPATSLLYQADCQLTYDETLGETVPGKLAPSVYAAGDVTGIHDLQIAILQGKVAGLEAASSLLDHSQAAASKQALENFRKELADKEKGYRERLQVSTLLAAPGQGKKRFVCVCEDATEKDIRDGIAEGFDDIQSLKRYSTVSMGPCQGKMCHKSFVGIRADQTGRSIGETGTTTYRPPVAPVSMGTLAGPAHFPMKRTPLDQKHREMGARMMDLGPWKRPHSYGAPQEECRAVRERVGIIDVSTLGKLDVQGKDAPALLDRVYTHIFSNLPVGRIRYGVLCSDSGTILDDGTITRLAEDRYFITTTTGNIDLIEEWMKWWLAGTNACVHIANVTSAFGAINVAGPRARETLSKLTDIDLSPATFKYMMSAQGQVAGVPAILLRIGFVGETGWEVHFPTEFAEYMWDRLMEAGKEFGIAPFGVEAQRILRLEKKHIIIGQDTDSVSNPLEADMSWVVRFDKGDFIGRRALEAVKERGLRDKLVGFVMEDSAVPLDGVPVVVNGKPVGRVTSSRSSHTVGRGFGLAWVPVEISEDGTQIHIQVNDRPLPAKVVSAAFYDPEGKRLRE